MSNVELLAPVGEWDSLVAAVQNGANAVYFGANEFNARMNSKNFNRDELKRAIEYAKLRNVKTNLTLNILIKNNEFEEAMALVEYAYKCGIDAIIVQDLGLAREIMKKFPNLDVHSSTQMTIYNLKGAMKIEQLGFKRCVLARELTIDEIKNITKNTNIEIEVFIHGALCISYSGQCLMSSIIGGRSGNRGKCAGTCRLPYNLLKDNQTVDSGYLLSSKDICTLDILPELISAGVKSFKIEGRMKSPEYVGLVTSIYKKYINLANSKEKYEVQEKDRECLMQIFNRGGFSTGYLKGKLGKEMMYKYKPNHMGIYIGKVEHYNPSKGYVKVKLEKNLNLGDSIIIQENSCKISELMIGNSNIKEGNIGQIITVGRIHGKIIKGDKVYKTVSVNLNKNIEKISNKENIKRKINCKMVLIKNYPITLTLQDSQTKIIVEKHGVIPEEALKTGLTEERIVEQLSKLGNTVFEIDNIKIKLDKMLQISIKEINELRREAIQELENKIKQSFRRNNDNKEKCSENFKQIKKSNTEITVCLNYINKNFEYKNLKEVDNIYIPLRFFCNDELKNQIKTITQKFNTYLLMPTINKSNYEKIDVKNILNQYNIQGIVVSNLSQIEEFKNICKIANYTFNIANNYSINELKKMGIVKYTVSPEFEKEVISNLSQEIEKEVIVYGRTQLMTTEYCCIGKNKNCQGICEKSQYKLKDRMGFEFPIYTDRTNCNNLIYNSKITSIKWNDLNVNSIRIDILNETIEQINNIIEIHKEGKRFEGQEYTNCNLNRAI